MKLWLDDIRDPAKFGHIGWTWVKTADEAIEALKTGQVTQASLDHDLSIGRTLGYDDGEKTGHDVVVWMEENGVYPEDGVEVHSQNPVGKRRMLMGLYALRRRIWDAERSPA